MESTLLLSGRNVPGAATTSIEPLEGLFLFVGMLISKLALENFLRFPGKRKSRSLSGYPRVI